MRSGATRYHFEIKNRHINHCLWVGSSCILKFQVDVFDNDTLLNAKDSAKKLEVLKRKMRLESCINALRKLASSENNKVLSDALDFYIKNKYLTPKFAHVVFWRMSVNNIDHSPSFFNVSVKKERYKKDLAEMELFRVHVIWPALSSSQRKLAISCGHSEPDAGKKVAVGQITSKDPFCRR